MRPVPAQRRVLKAPEESIVSVNDQPATSQHRAKFQPEDLLRQAQVQDVALSPDGSSVVYSRRVIADNAYRTHLWIVPWSGGDARQLTHAAVNDTRPVFSPDGRSLAFLSDRGGRERPWILPLNGGEPRLAAEIAGDARAVHWSPDGRRLLITVPSGVERLAVGDPADPTARVIDDFAWRLDKTGLRNQLVSAWVAPVDGEPRRLTDPAWEVLDARWLPDGRHIAVVADAEPDAGMRRSRSCREVSPRSALLRMARASRSSARTSHDNHLGRITISTSVMARRYDASNRISIAR
jgi:Tol biopolymer transport system component